VKVAIVAARFNAFIVDKLVDGAVATFRESGLGEGDITIAHVPGAFEIPAVARRIAEGGGYDAIVCLGCVIRGETTHYDYVAGHAAYGVGKVALKAKIPVIFGVLTTENSDQAIARGDKGVDAARAALEMVALYQKLDGQNESKTA
jgi:6,7-dimethyl-8-ribityllumazine synthase